MAKAEMTVNLADYDEVKEAIAELNRLRTAMAKLNRLRSNIVMTQSASWSNSMYPLVAILDEAGYEAEGATEEQQKEHMACYGGAGKMPRLLNHTPRPEHLVGNVGKAIPGQEMRGSIQIHAERWRQIEEEGWTDDHDDHEHTGGELILAAIAYALASAPDSPCSEDTPAQFAETWWPWEAGYWKPSDDPVRNLVKAGALLAAEIDRVQRDG